MFEFLTFCARMFEFLTLCLNFSLLAHGHVKPARAGPTKYMVLTISLGGPAMSLGGPAYGKGRPAWECGRLEKWEFDQKGEIIWFSPLRLNFSLFVRVCFNSSLCV